MAPAVDSAQRGSSSDGSMDEEAIDAVLRGDVDRYAELVRRHQRQAWMIAYGFVGNFEDAREISQNAFVKAYRHLRHFRRRAKFSTWLYRIIANECKDWFRRRARQPRLTPLSLHLEDDDSVMFDVADPSGSPLDALANRELAKQLGQAIRRLSGKQQEAFVLHHVNGLSLEEASQVMGCRVGTVKAHLFRACGQDRKSVV